jgi:hypothetical protein
MIRSFSLRRRCAIASTRASPATADALDEAELRVELAPLRVELAPLRVERALDARA